MLKKKEIIISLMGGIIISFILELIVFFVALFNWDFSKKMDLNMGKGIFNMFNFICIEDGFQVELGIGFLIYAFLGGIVILALSIAFRKVFKIEVI